MKKTKVILTTEAKMTMRELMSGLHIYEGDIVVVNGTVLICNDKYDLVTLENKYSSTIPNLIIGMVSGKYSYKVYSVKSVLEYEKPSARC